MIPTPKKEELINTFRCGGHRLSLIPTPKKEELINTKMCGNGTIESIPTPKKEELINTLAVSLKPTLGFRLLRKKS